MKHGLFTASSVLLAMLLTSGGAVTGEKGDHMTTLNLKRGIAEGKDKQVDLLFEGPRRKIVQITLRNGGVLESHRADEPITIQCIAGKGTLTIGRGLPDDSSSDEKKSVALVPEVLVTIESNIVHEITSQPAVSLLLSRFAEK